MAGVNVKGVSSGSTLLNLACTGKTKICFKPGHFYLFVGDSESGKTFLALTVFAEVCQNPAYNDYRVIFDNPERGALMDIKRYFGSGVAERLEPPSKGQDDQPVYSETVEELYYHLSDAYDDGRPFIYVLDSMDALESQEDRDKFADQKKAHRKGREATGSYGTAKAKANSQGLRRAITELPKTGSILIIITQTRDAIGQFGWGDKKTRAGGRALRFYATLEIWSSVKEQIKKLVRGKKRKVGIVSKVQVKKNRVSGRDRVVYVPILLSMGIDDIGSMVDYLVDEGHWKIRANNIAATELDLTLPRDKLIAAIEEGDRERDLQLIVGKVWEAIENETTVKRKPRYV